MSTSVPDRSSRRTTPRWLWAVLLAGPVVASVHFWVVYLAAEAACAEGVHLLDRWVLRIAIVGATALAVAVTAFFAVRAIQLWGRDGAEAPDLDDNRRFTGFTGLLLAAMFLVFVLLVAAPTIGSTLC